MVTERRPLAIVTGATRGLGRLIADELCGGGADVLIVGRNEASINSALAALPGPGRGYPLWCDLEASDAATTIAEAAEQLGGATILVNNAAIQGPIGPVWGVDPAEFARTLRIDYLAAVELCRAVLPGMIARGAGWIVNISGGGATGPRPQFAAYGTAKAALVRFGETIAAEADLHGVRVNSIAPGAFSSRMTEAITAAGEAASGDKEMALARRLLAQGDDSAAHKAAELVRYLVLGEGRDITGKLISAVWDPWPTLHHHLQALRDSDIYTLRRIMPSDRGQSWDKT